MLVTHCFASHLPLAQEHTARQSFKQSPSVFLDDVSVDGTRVLATFDQAECDNKEETIVFDDRPSPRREGSHHRANQEYYDVLEMASNRLRQDSSVVNYDSSGDEGRFIHQDGYLYFILLLVIYLMLV